MSGAPDDDEIEASRAPLLTHLVELRSRLIICVIALFVGFIVCFAFSQQILLIIVHPYTVAQALQTVRSKTSAGGQGIVGTLVSAWTNARDMFLVLAGQMDAPTAKSATTLISTAPLELFFTKVKLAVQWARGGALSFPGAGRSRSTPSWRPASTRRSAAPSCRS